MRKRPRLLPESRASKAAVESPGSERMPGVIGDVASTYGAGHEAADAAVGRRHDPVEEAVDEVVRRDPRGDGDDEQSARPQYAAHLGDESMHVGQIFQHPHREHRVEGRRGVRERIGVADDVVRAITPRGLLVIRSRPRDGRLYDVESPVFAYTLDERTGHQTRAA